MNRTFILLCALAALAGCQQQPKVAAQPCEITREVDSVGRDGGNGTYIQAGYTATNWVNLPAWQSIPTQFTPYIRVNHDNHITTYQIPDSGRLRGEQGAAVCGVRIKNGYLIAVLQTRGDRETYTPIKWKLGKPDEMECWVGKSTVYWSDLWQEQALKL